MKLEVGGFELVTLEFAFVTCRFELVPRWFELVACGFELVDLNSNLCIWTHTFEFYLKVTRKSCFTISQIIQGSLFFLTVGTDIMNVKDCD